MSNEINKMECPECGAKSYTGLHLCIKEGYCDEQESKKKTND